MVMPRARGLFGREDDQKQVLLMPMYGHHMTSTHHQTAPCPFNALYMHAATCRYFCQVCGCPWWPVGVDGGPKSSWGVRLRTRAKSSFAHVRVRTPYDPQAPPNNPRPFQYTLHALSGLWVSMVPYRQAKPCHMYQKSTSVNK